MWRWIATLLVLIAGAIANCAIISEFYGGGPPYYSRTENMDKWSNPLPTLVALNLGLVLICALLFILGRKRRRLHQV